MRKKAREKQESRGFPEPQRRIPPELRNQRDPVEPQIIYHQLPRKGEDSLPSELWFQIFCHLVSLNDLISLEMVRKSSFLFIILTTKISDL